MIDVIKSSVEQLLRSFNLSTSGELASDQESASDDVSFFWTSCLQNFYSSKLQASFLFIPLLSFVLPKPMLK